MRTTVTLNTDVERLLKQAMFRSRKSFKETLNSAVRAGLTPKNNSPKSSRLRVKTRPMGLRPGIDPAGFNKLASELEVESLFQKLSACVKGDHS